MSAREYAFYVQNKQGEQVCILPGDEIPTWAHSQLDARHLDAGGSSDGIPPKSGKGSGKEAWAEYATANDVEFDPEATRDDIVDACEAAGVPTDAE